MDRRRIAITGFMCSGKTTVARALALLLGCEATDLDEFISQVEQRSPKQIIQQNSEEAFRETENRVLAAFLLRDAAPIVSLGGGTWTAAKNRSLLAQHGFQTVWLDAPFELCWDRIEAGDDQRPLAQSYDAAKARYDERLAAYGLADIRLKVAGSESAEEIAARIVALVLPNDANKSAISFYDNCLDHEAGKTN